MYNKIHVYITHKSEIRHSAYIQGMFTEIHCRNCPVQSKSLQQLTTAGFNLISIDRVNTRVL